ncbi:MAG: hypothetical protein MJ000_03840 [Bacteroidales bacterium]|nr:hypothetical protein [Bacteroidales bacterium]
MIEPRIIKALMDRKWTLLFWGVCLGIVISALVLPNGLLDQFSNHINENALDSKSFFELFLFYSFWAITFSLLAVYIIWCIHELISLVKKLLLDAREKNIGKEQDTAFKPKIVDVSALSNADTEFLYSIIDSDDKPTLLAVALVLKDFVEERNQTICNNQLSAYIPTYDYIRENTSSSITALVSALDMMNGFKNDKYYNPALIRSIINSSNG